METAFLNKKDEVESSREIRLWNEFRNSWCLLLLLNFVNWRLIKEFVGFEYVYLRLLNFEANVVYEFFDIHNFHQSLKFLIQSYLPTFSVAKIGPEWLKSSQLDTSSSWVYRCWCLPMWSVQSLMSKFFQSHYQS